MGVPDGPGSGFLYLFADADSTGLTGIREVGEGTRDGVLVEALGQFYRGRRNPRRFLFAAANRLAEARRRVPQMGRLEAVARPSSQYGCPANGV